MDTPIGLRAGMQERHITPNAAYWQKSCVPFSKKFDRVRWWGSTVVLRCKAFKIRLVRDFDERGSFVPHQSMQKLNEQQRREFAIGPNPPFDFTSVGMQMIIILVYRAVSMNNHGELSQWIKWRKLPTAERKVSDNDGQPLKHEIRTLRVPSKGLEGPRSLRCGLVASKTTYWGRGVISRIYWK